MKIVDFTRAHIPEATELALAGYEEERRHIPALPPSGILPDLTGFADNRLGVAAFEEEGRMAGFLCCYPPCDNAFGSTYVKGVFSPMGANAAIRENRGKIYAAMYQAAGEKWVRAGAVSHAVCLYAHDEKAQRQFFLYGFGLRCVDAVRPMEPIDCMPCREYEFTELAREEYASVYPLDLMLNRHQCTSPFFMYRAPDTLESFINSYTKRSSRFFAAKYRGELCAYLKILKQGETFITGQPDYANITGAFCLPEHRGKGVYQTLLNFTISTLGPEGYTRLGVDFESFNPTAYGFWSKYFAAYTHSVVRRIDERVLDADA